MNEITQRLADALREANEALEAVSNASPDDEIINECSCRYCVAGRASEKIDAILAALDAQPQDAKNPGDWSEANGLHDVVEKLCSLAGVALPSDWHIDDHATIGALDDVRFALWRAYNGKREDVEKLKAEVERLRERTAEAERGEAAYYNALADVAAALGMEVWAHEEVAPALRARIAQLESGWVRVEERLPEDRVYVLAVTNKGCVGEARFTEERGWVWVTGDPVLWDITHWRPLPPAPETQEDAR